MYKIRPPSSIAHVEKFPVTSNRLNRAGALTIEIWCTTVLRDSGACIYSAKPYSSFQRHAATALYDITSNTGDPHCPIVITCESQFRCILRFQLLAISLNIPTQVPPLARPSVLHFFSSASPSSPRNPSFQYTHPLHSRSTFRYHRGFAVGEKLLAIGYTISTVPDL